MILVTGAAGFIGSHLAQALQKSGHHIAMSDVREKWSPPEYWMANYDVELDAVFHLGAVTDTTCENWNALDYTNCQLPSRLWDFCVERQIPLLYASSASVHGNGSGPLNKYAESKISFDNFAEHAVEEPPHWYGLRFFNVYGAGEAHKGAQASMVYKALNGHRKFYDLKAKRDFVHVDDVVSVMLWCWKNKPPSGIYDVGTGTARSVGEMARLCGVEPVEIGVPEALRGKLQTHTQADLTKLRAAGYEKPFLSLEEGIARMRQ